MLYDRNPTHALVLDDTAYRAMTPADADAPLAECDYAYLKQRHYVARTKAAGLSVSSEALLPGWEQMDAKAWMAKLA